MNASSDAYVVCKVGENRYTWHFTGILSIEHSLSLTLDSASVQGADIVNGARNQPDRLTLRVLETDAEHSRGWAAAMLEAMASLKRYRYLCKVVTSLGTYKNMLLSEITATQDEENQFGWSGSLTFTEYVKSSAAQAKAADNSSTRVNTGAAGSVILLDETAYTQLLRRAGVIS